MCWAVGILLLPLGDFHNLMYHPIKDFLLIFSFISPPFSQLHGFVPHGSSILIFSPVQHLRLILLYLHQNITAQYLCISGFSYRQKQVSKPIISSSSSWLPHFDRRAPSTQVLFRWPNCIDKELPTFQCLNMFASAYAPLDCWFLHVHLCLAPFDVYSTL